MCPAVLPLLFILLFTASCNEKNKGSMDCSGLKTGKFEYRGEYSKERIRIERQDSTQVEYEPNGRDGLKMKIKWISDCQYDLIYLSHVIDGRDTVKNEIAFPVIHTSITAVTPNYYICKSSMQGTSFRRTDTMLILQ